MDLKRVSSCGKFIPNQFNRNRCQSCFRSMDVHSDEALHSRKMNRKLIKCGFLYVAPEAIDFNVPSQRSKRWQRRWFALYDDGELSYALDQHADTVPQRIIDMTTCAEVIEAEQITGHTNSLRIRTHANDCHYVKADNAEEIKWWRDLLCIYSKQLTRRKMHLDLENKENCRTNGANIEKSGPTLVQIKNSLFRDRSQRRTSDPLSQAKVDIIRPNDASYHGTPRSVKNRRTGRCRDETRSKTFSEFDTTGANIDHGPAASSTNRPVDDSITEGKESVDDCTNWTVQLRTGKSASETNGAASFSQPDSKKGNGPNQNGSQCGEAKTAEKSKSLSPKKEIPEVVSKSECKSGTVDETICRGSNSPLNQTLRKGWLMLRGRSDNDWAKYWVVLAGLSLKMYKDAWAEDGCIDASVQIDLTDCQSVSPLGAARNYGIEIKCKHQRYVLSALTPGIRDSWIAAIQQNLAASSVEDGNAQGHFTHSPDRHDQPKKRRIAYVAPESHRRDAACETDGDEEEDDTESFRSNSRADEVSVSGRSLESSTHELASDGETSTYSGLRSPRRRRSLSPTIRRSPVSRVKERDTSRRQRSPAQTSTRSPSDNHRSNASPSVASERPVLVNCEVSFDGTVSEGSGTEANVIVMLQQQLETVRQELERTRGRLSETESENERLQIATNGDRREASRNGATAETAFYNSKGDTEAELERLRKTLQEAERDIWSKQEEIEVLTRKLDYSVNELSDTETVLSSSLHDLDNDRAKFSSLSADWSRRVNAMEKQLRKTIQRLDERERELMLERSADRQKLSKDACNQRRSAAAVTTEQSEPVIDQLQSKLVESEAQVVALNRRLREMTAGSSDIANGINYASVPKPINHQDECEKLTDDREHEIRFDSLRHYCYDQNRRLLATLKNETEFLQSMVDTKLVSSSPSQSSMTSELGELSDDLIAVHHYIGEMEQHLQLSDTQSPDDFMKDFNFKDVLNRLVEVQERFATMARRESTPSTVRDVSDSDCRENGNALKSARILSSLHENLLESANVSVVPCTTASNTAPALQFSTYWNYCVSVLHADLARSISAYLEKKYEDSTHCTVLTSDDFQAILAETMTLEACLITEIANVIESSKNEDHLKFALKLRDIRNTFVTLRRLDELLDEPVDDQRMAAILEHRLDANFFNILCEETKSFVLAHLNDLVSSLPFNWQKKMRFGPADSDARSMALQTLSKNLLRDLVVFESNSDETSSCSIELLRCTVMKDEITHILSRLETNLDAFGAGSVVDGADGAGRVVVEAVGVTAALCDRLMEKLNVQISDLFKKPREGAGRSDIAGRHGEFVKARVTNSLKNLKHHPGSNVGAARMTTAGRMVHLESAFREELKNVGSVEMWDQSELKLLASLKSARAIVRGYRSWIASCYGEELSQFKPSSKYSLDFRVSSTGSQFGEFLSSGLKLTECVSHYEPLTKQLFFRILSSISAKLVAVQLSVYYECQMKAISSAQQESLNGAMEKRRCDYCDAGISRGGENGSRHRAREPVEHEDPFLPRISEKEELSQWRRFDGRFGAPTNVPGEVAELEQEILEMQSYHSDEMEAMRSAHEAELETLRQELRTEQERRNKLHADMIDMKKITDHSLATLERVHAQLIEEVKIEHRREIQLLTRDYEKTLNEEKQATRQALDALQKAHESDLHKQAEKLRSSLSSRRSVASDYDNDDGYCGRQDVQEALQDMSRQLSEVSSAYSTKCIENLRMEERLQDTQKILTQVVASGSLPDEIVQQLDAVFDDSEGALEEALNVKETEITRYKELVRQLESELSQTQDTLASYVKRKEMDSAVANTAARSGSVPKDEIVSSSSASSEDLDDEDDIAAEYQPKVARRRAALSNNRRGDSRYHSTPNLGEQAVADAFLQNGQQKISHGLAPDRILLELRNVMGLTVTERRRYFENLCKPS